MVEVEVDGIPARWTKVYWPIAMAISIIAFIISPFALRGEALVLGCCLLGIPELYCVLRRRWVDTFSVWVWDRLGETRSTPINKWNAEHFLSFGCFLLVAADVATYTFSLGIIPFGVTLIMTVWLAFHFFFFWWR